MVQIKKKKKKTLVKIVLKIINSTNSTVRWILFFGTNIVLVLRANGTNRDYKNVRFYSFDFCLQVHCIFRA